MGANETEDFSCEVWNDDDEFVHTIIIVRDGHAFWYGTTQERGSVEDLRSRTQLSLIPSEELYPELPNGVKLCDSQISMDQMHVRRPEARSYDQKPGNHTIANEFLAEIRIYEQVSARPHRNLVRYNGCLVDNGRVVGIVLDRYLSTLHDRKASMGHASRMDCFNSVKAGLAHLHELGLAHNDVNPSNIMFDKDGQTVIIDFDSCAPLDMELAKGGTPGWDEGFSSYSSVSNDEIGLKVLKEYLELH